MAGGRPQATLGGLTINLQVVTRCSSCCLPGSQSLLLSALVSPSVKWETGVCQAGVLLEETVPGRVPQTWHQEASRGHRLSPLQTWNSLDHPGTL